ncbi:MarR family winged helix-turn-helix transcriptional regulator [Arthrobacter sp. HY1533]|uniref:MarR family winged helix-turn-helix transcriptional regulator n=1 Tax=Arthrobacter sp. HY1533 TaxID=2970919 RepID=UPI002FD1C916
MTETFRSTPVPKSTTPAPGSGAPVQPASGGPAPGGEGGGQGPGARAAEPASRTGRAIGAGPLAAELRVAVMRTSRRLRAEAASREISPGQYSVLAAILNGPRTVGQLAAREQIQAPSMTRIVNDLVAAGLAERGENPQDKRQVLVAITPTGSAALLRARSKRTAWLAKRVAALTPQQRATLHEAALILQEMSA